jgi:hypothetical protein
VSVLSCDGREIAAGAQAQADPGEVLVELREPSRREDVRRLSPDDRERERLARAELHCKGRIGRLRSFPDPWCHLTTSVASATPDDIGSITDRSQ